MNQNPIKWKPLNEKFLDDIRKLFHRLFPKSKDPVLADEISDYWIHMLKNVWETKPETIKDKDLRFLPADPLSRIQQKTVVIAYADSIRKTGEYSLDTLDTFLDKYFPSVCGLHMLPACRVDETRFNDGYFSQVERDSVHDAFGTNEKFARMMADYYSMADFVLNHVDINNPFFQAYLDGDDEKGNCFFVFSEPEYQRRLKNGDFDTIFRPRPFPLFTIFRKKPEQEQFRTMTHQEKIQWLNRQFEHSSLPDALVSLLSIFPKIKNDQMLLEEDYRHITGFIEYLKSEKQMDADAVFTVSAIQETQHTPFIFNEGIETMEDLLRGLGYESTKAAAYAGVFRQFDADLFGEPVRALTTFSHVQVDLNTSTFEGLKMLADDFSWYLGMDLNMLRLDAANFAFKKWGTSCFGLPEVKDLMKILYLSLDSVSPRIVANLEVNDQLSSVLTQMADKKAPPPMMYDFHLAGMLPVVFNTQNPGILTRIGEMITAFEIPRESIRFSLAESHDGKSVRGSMDLLSLAERQGLADTIEKNGGRIKYKGVPKGQYPVAGFKEVCEGAEIDERFAVKKLFRPAAPADEIFYLKDSIENEARMADALEISEEKIAGDHTLKFFINTVLKGREPYELCVSTRDGLTRLKDFTREADRYLAFYTLGFALMGRHVKSIYFNDLVGLSNDDEKMRQTGELRDIKRKKSDVGELEETLADTASMEHHIASGINRLIALVDADPALNFRGDEAVVIPQGEDGRPCPVAVVLCRCQDHVTLVVVNTGVEKCTVSIDVANQGFQQGSVLHDNVSGGKCEVDRDGNLKIEVLPYQRLWLTKSLVISKRSQGTASTALSDI